MKNILTILSFLFTSVYASVYAADQGQSHYYFSHISGDNGLSQSNVKAIIQDSYGFMWFGTKNGLNRFDGKSIVQMDCSDHISGRGNNNIAALFEDTDRNLWVGTDRGVFLYNPQSDLFTFIDHKTEDGMTMDNWIADIVSDSSGNIWVVIPDQGVFRYKDSTLYYYEVTDKKNFKSEAPNCICVRANGEVWIGTWGVGLFRYNEKIDAFEQYATDRDGRSLLGKNISYISDYGDWIAIAIHEGGIKKYHPQTQTLVDVSLPGANDTFVRNIMNFDNELWIGTHEGLFILDEKQNKTTHLKEDLMRDFSLSDKIIYTMYKDREGGIWIGTMFGGVNYLPRRQLLFDKYVPGSEQHSLSTKRVRELVEDSNGNIWIGTEDDGINKLNPVTGEVKQIRSGKSGSKAHLITLSMTIYQDELYCGLFKQGMDVIKLADSSIRNYKSEELNIEEGSVYFFHIDNKGYKWIGAGWGLYRAQPNTFNFEKLEQVGYDWIFDVLEEKDGTLWFASMGSGVWRYNPAEDSFKQYPCIEGDDTTLSSNSVSSVMQDSRGRIWFSTDRGGICRYNADTDDFTTFSVNEGLPDDVAYKILEDDYQNLWFGTNKGLVKFNPDNGQIRVFTIRDGLLGNQFNYKSALKASDGKFYFGGIDGLVSFNPNVSDKVDSAPPIYISRFSIYNEEITVHTPKSPLKKCIIHTDHIELTHNQSNISFDIALLNYSTAESNQYYYMMEPLDRDWIKAGSNQNISYAKLPPGNYNFKVQATHNTAAGTFTGRTLSIVILPPWWQSTWAYIIYFQLGLCIVVGWFLWYRRRKEREMEERQKIFEIEKEKELYESKVQFFTEIAHEVRTPLTLINGPVETLQEMNIDNPKITRNIEVIGQNTQRLLNLTGQLLDFQKIGVNKFQMKFETVDITTLLNETIARFEPTILQKNKELLIHIPDEEVQASVDREAITKILSNLLNNALKYANHSIIVELQQNQDTFIVHVISDGEKIPAGQSEQIFEPFYQNLKDASTSGVGIGLSLARSLAILHKGQLYLDTNHARNSFVLEIPLNREAIQLQHERISNPNTVILDEEITADTENTKGYTLLLVEDNEAMLSFIREKLEESFTVESAQNGQEALDILHNNHIDLVISDIMMPVMDGWELCKAIKSDIDISHIPVIFLTAKNDLDSKINGLKIGAEAYVEKPFSFNYLKTQVFSLLNNRSKEREAFSKRPFFPVNNMQMNKADKEFMEKVISVIYENIVDENFNVERMADILCMSRSNLLRKIKLLFNLSPVDFIRLIRLKKAAELIQEGKYRIVDICEMVGINSPSYFSKLFLKQFGMTPKEFEKRGVKTCD
ncbi:two-component regulator propeller domain-containing protein [Bacteroides sp. 519]|uniref:hybrid sensor histidine kinase/response regulator transcription factor n=1 Tax=Bacteroides sp. 519 TaxID=2302937 RepID=UPI0013CFAD33|nr:two-component regulator propeller domain-containing protein [Bacteroides sp. 519]NDV57424.1 response regulator [Bacteroides sp. 519]